MRRMLPHLNSNDSVDGIRPAQPITVTSVHNVRVLAAAKATGWRPSNSAIRSMMEKA